MLRAFRIAAAFCAFAIVAAAAQAETWPARPLTMVVPFAAGGPIDAVGRILQADLGDALRQQVIVENIGGGGGAIGAARVARAVPDGYEFLLGNLGTQAVSQALYKNPPYHSNTDFTPVMLIADLSLVLVARKDLPADNLQQFIAYVKANHDKMQFASAGVGSATHLGCALLNSRIGVEVTHIPYRGGALAMQDLMAQRVDYLCIDTPVAMAQIASRTVKPIAILTRERSSVLPDLASASEQGLSDFDAANWCAFFLPKNTPAPIVDALHDAAVKALDDPGVQKRLHDIGVDPVPGVRRSPGYLAKFVAAEIDKWAGAIKAAGVGAQ